MSKNKRKYIESHWLIFAVKGVISLFAGVCLVLTTKTDAEYLACVVSIAMMGLAILEIINVLHRRSLELNWGFTLGIGIMEFISGVILLSTLSIDNPVAAIPIRILALAVYMCYASVLSIMIGFKNLKNYTDSMMWITGGIIGAILSFAMLSDGGLLITHIHIFGLYSVVKGITDLYFGIHSRDELAELHAQRVAKIAAAKTKKKESR